MLQHADQAINWLFYRQTKYHHAGRLVPVRLSCNNVYAKCTGNGRTFLKVASLELALLIVIMFLELRLLNSSEISIFCEIYSLFPP